MATRKTESNPYGWTSASEVDKVPALITADERLPKGHVNPWHSHDSGCLIYPAQGVVTVETEAGSYVVPPQRAVWLPAGMAHQTSMNGEVSLQSLIIDSAAFEGVPQGACVVAITPLLRELILHACRMSAEQPVEGPTERLVSVLVDQLTALQAPALPLPVPQERRLRRTTHLKREDIRIQEITLTSDQQVPWHYHSQIRDTFLVLGGGDALPAEPKRERLPQSRR